MKSFVERLSRLARVELSEEEAKIFEKEIESIKKFIEKILEISLENVEPLFHPLGEKGKLRSDKPSQSLPSKVVIDMALESREGYVKAPRTIED